jgi:hypothetical protein
MRKRQVAENLGFLVVRMFHGLIEITRANASQSNEFPDNVCATAFRSTKLIRCA